MASTFAGHELYAKKVLKCLPAQLNFLGAFSTDISGELVGPAKSVEVPLVEMDEAGTFDRSSNNFARPGGTPKSATVTLGDPIIAGFAVTADQASKIEKRFWEGKAELNVTSVAASAQTAVTNLVTKANFAKAVTNVGNRTMRISAGGDVVRFALGCDGRYEISARMRPAADVSLKPGEGAEWSLTFGVRRVDCRDDAKDAAAEPASVPATLYKDPAIMGLYSEGCYIGIPIRTLAHDKIPAGVDPAYVLTADVPSHQARTWTRLYDSEYRGKHLYIYKGVLKKELSDDDEYDYE